jgi:hypothetical protein
MSNHIKTILTDAILPRTESTFGDADTLRKPFLSELGNIDIVLIWFYRIVAITPVCRTGYESSILSRTARCQTRTGETRWVYHLPYE